MLILDGTTGCPVTTVTGTLPVANGGSGVTTSTGSGANVLGTSPTLATPVINSATVATVSGTAPLYMCRAWVNFNGTGTVAIRASGNVSSITDGGVGTYTANFTTAMPDANYSWTGSTVYGTLHCTLVYRVDLSHTYSSSALQIQNIMQVGAADATSDSSFVSIQIFR